MTPIKEIAPGIFMITQALSYKQIKFSVNVYVIAGRDGLIFDSGYGNRRDGNRLVRSIGDISDLMETRGEACEMTRALLSHGHWDHFSGLAHLQKALGVDVLATEKQAVKLKSKKIYKKLFWEKSEILTPPVPRFFEVIYDIWNSVRKEIYMALLSIHFISGQIKIVDENAKLSVNGENWEMIHVPGHCDDDIVLYNKKRGILFTGDVILRSITTWLGPPHSDLKVYLESLERLKNLPNLKLILPAHGSPIRDPRKRIQAAIDHREKKTNDLFKLLLKSGDKGFCFEQIFKSFYPKSRRFQRTILAGWIIVSLKYLLDKGDIISDPDGKTIRFRVIK